jgi:hypothetical protein
MPPPQAPVEPTTRELARAFVKTSAAEWTRDSPEIERILTRRLADAVLQEVLQDTVTELKRRFGEPLARM